MTQAAGGTRALIGFEISGALVIAVMHVIRADDQLSECERSPWSHFS